MATPTPASASLGLTLPTRAHKGEDQHSSALNSKNVQESAL
jgi:hypothetical protein